MSLDLIRYQCLLHNIEVDIFDYLLFILIFNIFTQSWWLLSPQMPETFQVWSHMCCYKNSAEHSKDTGRAPNTRWCIKKQDWKCLFLISCAWRSSRCLIPPPSRQACVIPASAVTLTYNCVVKHQPVFSLCSCVSSGESQREGLGMACPSAWVRMEGEKPKSNWIWRYVLGISHSDLSKHR